MPHIFFFSFYNTILKKPLTNNFLSVALFDMLINNLHINCLTIPMSLKHKILTLKNLLTLETNDIDNKVYYKNIKDAITIDYSLIIKREKVIKT